MTDTAELIARADNAVKWCEAENDHVPIGLMYEMRMALATQAREIERWAERAIADARAIKAAVARAETAEAEVKRIMQMAIGDIYAEWGRRVEAAEARVREVEALHDVTLAACDTWKADRDAIEAETIERCRTIAYQYTKLPEADFATASAIEDKIRALRHIGREG